VTIIAPSVTPTPDGVIDDHEERPDSVTGDEHARVQSVADRAEDHTQGGKPDGLHAQGVQGRAHGVPGAGADRRDHVLQFAGPLPQPIRLNGRTPPQPQAHPVDEARHAAEPARDRRRRRDDADRQTRPSQHHGGKQDDGRQLRRRQVTLREQDHQPRQEDDQQRGVVKEVIRQTHQKGAGWREPPAACRYDEERHARRRAHRRGQTGEGHDQREPYGRP